MAENIFSESTHSPLTLSNYHFPSMNFIRRKDSIFSMAFVTPGQTDGAAI